ncbi:ribosome-associated translation inhibitor RaiA [Campylobacter sp. US33a]|uniref:Ribosome hibernation promoting factor n=1 Tax=Campylobacter sp. CCS1377 TaxID=3158229 RepID=A0AAU7E440_9BACT|nr:ribosome-associated translation inhibitor RaiA [Campylobacter sp. US33a]MCW1360992.1 ribosome-associated translation inhibitor RaiA [Campylobacter jejuni]TEY03439.1 ribosome-associated translation inhibitor RaiA [Campylobacter sp. US33a]
MNTSIVGKQFHLSDAIKEYVEKSFDALTKYNLDLISIRCVLAADEKHGKKGFWAEFNINLAGHDTIVVKQKDKDLYAAIDLAIERLSKILRRTHDKNVTHKNQDEIKEAPISSFVEEDEIVPVELDLYKPLEIDEALERLKASNDIFLVFNDTEAKMRVLFKKKDGKFGLF